MMPHRYRIYGLCVECDRPLSGLDRETNESSADTVVHWGMVPAGVDPASWQDRYTSVPEEGERPALIAMASVSAGWLRLHYTEGVTFYLDAEARHLWCAWEAPMTEADAMTFLLGPVLGYVLRHRGVLALHASAVVMGGVAVAFVGPGGAGKSTLAAALGRAGLPVLTDDVLAIRRQEERWTGWPAYDHLRLWGESESLLFGGTGRLRPLTPTWEKLAYPMAEFDTPRSLEPAPLGAIFLLTAREASDAAPRLEAMSAVEAFLALSANSYANYLLDDRMRRAEVEAVGSVVRSVWTARLVPPEHDARLEQLVRFIVQQLGERRGAAATA